MKWSIEAAVASYQPAQTGADRDTFAARLAVCEGCKHRSESRCLKQPAVPVSVLARMGNCPLYLFPGQTPPAARPGLSDVPRIGTIGGEYDPVQRLVAVTCFFNPAGYRKPAENYNRFAAGVEAAGVELWTVELAFDDRPFDLPDGPRVFRLRDDSGRATLWQKERLLNWIIQQLPSSVDAVAWLDCDVILLRNDWPRAVRRALEDWQVIQPFDRSFLTGPTGSLESHKHSCGWAWQHDPQRVLSFAVYHPGFAWAGRMEWIRRHGLLDVSVIGNGDSWMVSAFAGGGRPYDARLTNPTWEAAMASWAQRAATDVRARLGYIHGALVHLYHGHRKNRQYIDRYAFLKDGNFDPATDLEAADGCWRWSERALREKPEMVARVAAYFGERREDD